MQKPLLPTESRRVLPEAGVPQLFLKIDCSFAQVGNVRKLELGLGVTVQRKRGNEC